MNTTGPQAPVAVQQTTVIHVGSHKSVVGAVLLGFFLGPLGMLYATVVGALVMLIVNILVAIATLGLGLLITLPICALWAGLAASSHNSRLQTVATQHAATGAGFASPAAWHDDPEGSGRLRYYDGTRWTDHYAENPGKPAPRQIGSSPEAPAAEPEAGEPGAAEPDPGSDSAEEAEAPTAVAVTKPDKVFCGACGNSIDPGARFCSACGETQAVS
jgi:hypothetical protein